MCHFVSDDLAAMRLSRANKKGEPDLWQPRLPHGTHLSYLTVSLSPNPRLQTIILVPSGR